MLTGLASHAWLGAVIPGGVPWYPSFTHISMGIRRRSLSRGAPYTDVALDALVVVLPVVRRLSGHGAWHQPKWLGRSRPKVKFPH